jgi:hypothetical protein
VGVPVTVNIGGGGGGEAEAPVDLGDLGTSVDETLAGIEDVPVEDAVTNSDVLTADPAVEDIATLNPAQVTGLLAQAKTAVGQAADAVSVDKGIGQFGFKPEQLEAAGLLKPGTTNAFKSISAGIPTTADIEEAARTNTTPEDVARNRQILSKLASPTLWTGKAGVTNLGSLLSSSEKQSTVQQTLMNTAYNGLKSTGLVSGFETAQKIGGLINSATKFGVGDVTNWVKGGATAEISKALGISTKSAQYAVDFVSSKTTNVLGDLGAVGNSQLTGALGELTGPLRGIVGLGDQVGKLTGLTGLSGFAGELSQGIGGILSSGNALVGQIQGEINQITGAVTNQLNDLLASTGLNTTLSDLGLGSLGSFGDLGGLTSLGGFFGGGGSAIPAKYAVNTVNRAAIDRIVNAAVGDSKVPNITYDT